MRSVCCMGGTGGVRGRQQTKNREMEKKEAGREQGKVKPPSGRMGLGEVHGAPRQRRKQPRGEQSKGGQAGRLQAAPRRGAQRNENLLTTQNC